MKKSWKALAGVAVAAALVVAPVAVSGASASEVAPAVLKSPYVLALWASDASGTTWPEHLVSSAATISQVITGAEDFELQPCTHYRLDLYANDDTTAALLAAGVLNAPGTSAESWPGGHFRFWFQRSWTTRGCGSDNGGDDESLTSVTPAAPVLTAATCDADGSVNAAVQDGVDWTPVIADDGTSTYTAAPHEGYEFPADVQTVWNEPSLAQLTDGCPSTAATASDPTDPAPAADPADPSDTLAATGGSGVSPLLPIGGAVLVIGGIALAVTRRFAKR